MTYEGEIRAAARDARRLEDLYQSARRARAEDDFKRALFSCYEKAPENVLYAAWYYRLQERDKGDERAINWRLAFPLAAITGLAFWVLALARFDYPDGMPLLVVTGGLAGACAVVVFMALSGAARPRRAALAAAGLLLIGIYATLMTTIHDRENYRVLLLFHLPLLGWIATGFALLGVRSDHPDRFAFLIKSIEVFITGGLYVGAGTAFVIITVLLFEALGIRLSDSVMRLLLGGGSGLLPVTVVATVYDPRLSPIAQRFQRGLGRIIYTLMRFLLPLTLIVAVIYVIAIPFNFMEPFRNRDVLIIYNVMLFAIMGLLVGATPVHASDLSPRQQSALRVGILVLACLTSIVSLYALSATVYRTVVNGITMNRLTVIGWNAINTGILALLIARQCREGRGQWIAALQRTFSQGAWAYATWGLFLVIALPLLFAG